MSEANKTSFFPLLVLSTALLAWFGFQSNELYQERNRLQIAKTAQEETFTKSQKMRSQLDVIAAGTQKLADSGNTGAQTVVNAMKARGITINPAATGVAAQSLSTEQK